MLPVSEELKNKLKQLNRSLREAYPAHAFDERKIRERLAEIGTFHQVEKWEQTHLRDWLQGRTMIGVDGSVNSTKGVEMRTLSVFQALAKGTHGEEKWMADVHTPLLEDNAISQDGEAAQAAQQRGKLLSQLEMAVTMQAMKEWAPRVAMMDGSLLHFFIDDMVMWERVAHVAQEHDVLLVGVAEEIGTTTLAKTLFPEYPAWTDRDLLYGILRVGEAYEWQDWSPRNSQMWKMAFRSSVHPQPIGIDGLESQQEAKWELVKLVHSLTPAQGRGIPFWLDIIDNEVRVTNPLVQTMVEQYIDPDLRHRLFVPKRSDRII